MEIAVFGENIQRVIWDIYQSEQKTPNLSQIVKMKKLDNEGGLNEEKAMDILMEDKANQVEKVSFKYNDIQKYFPKSYTPKQMTEMIFKLLEDWQRERDNKEERST